MLTVYPQHLKRTSIDLYKVTTSLPKFNSHLSFLTRCISPLVVAKSFNLYFHPIDDICNNEEFYSEFQFNSFLVNTRYHWCLWPFTMSNIKRLRLTKDLIKIQALFFYCNPNVAKDIVGRIRQHNNDFVSWQTNQNKSNHPRSSSETFQSFQPRTQQRQDWRDFQLYSRFSSAYRSWKRFLSICLNSVPTHMINSFQNQTNLQFSSAVFS